MTSSLATSSIALLEEIVAVDERGTQRGVEWLARSFGLSSAAPIRSSDLEILSTHFSTVSLEAGTVLFSKGAIPEGVWILRTGAVELLAHARRRAVVVRVVGVGESVGDVQILSRTPAQYKARAAEESTCLFARAENLERLIREAPELARRWVTKLAMQVCRNQDRILELLSTSLDQKVARALLLESSDGEFPFSQAMLASMIGVHRSSISPLLKKFEKEGLISVAYRSICILDRDHLALIAD